jgi:23S rRNA pseudouridine955/2504/2580 synthase
MNTLGKKPVVRQVVIDEADAGQRLDNHLIREAKGVPKSHLYQLIRSGQVRINGKRTKPDYRLLMGDVLRLPPVRVAEKPSGFVPEGNVHEAVYEDAAILIINKPAGLAVHGGSGLSFGLIEQLRRQRPEARFLELAHRLDRETSGLLMVAKKRSALTALHDMFREPEKAGLTKRYLALVKGQLKNPVQHVHIALHKYQTAEGERRVRPDREGKPAHSIVRKKADYDGMSLLEVEIRTGRTHQIRVHLAHLGLPIAGDEKYGDFDWNPVLARKGLKRMFLHAASLSFTHPLTGQALHLEAPLPPELEAFLATCAKIHQDPAK